jgi:hypothetical protein
MAAKKTKAKTTKDKAPVATSAPVTFTREQLLAMLAETEPKTPEAPALAPALFDAPAVYVPETVVPVGAALPQVPRRFATHPHAERIARAMATKAARVASVAR